MELLYRLSLLAYPRSFRSRYGPPMLELYRVRQTRSRRLGRTRSTLHLLAALGDSVRNGIDERLGRSAIHAGPATPPHSPHRGRGPMLSVVLEETRHAVRRLLRAPAFATASILVLAIGIGANTALFSIVSAIMLRPQPFFEPERLVDVYQDSDDGAPNSSSFPAYRDMKNTTSVFEDAVAMASFSGTLQLEDGGRTVDTEIITSNYFAGLGVPLQAGAGLQPEHDLIGGEPVAVVSDATWRNLLGTDPDIVGKSVRINGAPVTVVGIAAPGYTGYTPGFHTDFFVSLSSMTPLWGDYVGTTLDRRDDHWFMVKARLADGVTPEQAQGAMTVLAERLAREFPELNEGRDITVFAPGEIRIHPEMDADLLPASASLMVMAGLLLLLVCSNVANLFLVRATSRQDEITLRLALGASRARVVTHSLSESVLLSLIGGALGVVGARFLMAAVESGTIPLPFPAAIDLRLDTQVLGYSAALAIGAGLLFGGLPGLRLARSEATGALRSGASTSTGGAFVRWTRNVLVGFQVAVSVVVLALAALYGQGLANAGSVDIGIGATDLAILRSNASHVGYDATEGYDLFEQYRQQVMTLPEIESAALAAQLPVRGTGGSSTLVIEGYEAEGGTDAVEVLRSTVGEGYFETLGIPVLYGETFPAPGVIVSRAMAEQYWGRTNVVGETIGFQSVPDLQVPIVAVVEDVKIRSLNEDPTPMFYTALSRQGAAAVYVVARTRGDASAALPTLRGELHALDPELPILQMTTLREHVADSLAVPRAGRTALSAFGALGLLLAGVGLYAVVAFSVQRRNRELGIRLALGAGRGKVVTMVLREMLIVTVIALAAGVILARLSAPFLADGLIGVDGVDAASIAVTTLLLAVTAMIAAWLPTRRAVNIDPVRALRE